MIQALDRNDKYLKVGYWYKRSEILQPDPHGEQSITSGGLLFRCKLLDMIKTESEYPTRNLSTDGERMSVETLYNIDVQKNDFVKMDGKWWLVEKTFVGELEKREKSLGLVRLNFSNKRTILYLLETTISR